MESKSEWRTWAEGFDRSEASGAISHHLEAWKPLHGKVLSYLPMGTEPDLSSVHSLNRCSIVVTRTGDGVRLSLHRYDVNALERHRLGFLQPTAGSEQVADDDIDVILVPGLVFDRSGARLGRGGGYYDRLLERLAPGAVRVGVTIDQTFVSEVPSEPHDQNVAWVVTESGVHRTGVDVSDATNRFIESAIAVGVAPDIHRFDSGTKTSQDAADAVGVTLGEIAKSILFAVDDRFVLALSSGDKRIDESKLAQHCGASSVRIAKIADVMRVTGFPAGGTPGIGLPDGVDVVADVGLARYRWVWSAGGTSDTVYPIAVDRLVAASRARWADISPIER